MDKRFRQTSGREKAARSTLTDNTIAQNKSQGGCRGGGGHILCQDPLETVSLTLVSPRAGRRCHVGSQGRDSLRVCLRTTVLGGS